MKQCLRCDREYPDSQKFCEADGTYVVGDEDIGDRPADLCPACDGLSPGISMDGETIMHCPVCSDTGKVTPEQADRWQREVAASTGSADLFNAQPCRPANLAETLADRPGGSFFDSEGGRDGNQPN